jgi:hypothetical protein
MIDPGLTRMREIVTERDLALDQAGALAWLHYVRAAPNLRAELSPDQLLRAEAAFRRGIECGLELFRLLLDD